MALAPSNSPPKGLALSVADWAIVQSALATHLPGHEVWAFGSRVSGREKPLSDLDLVIVGTTAPRQSAVSDLQDDLRESDLPFKVDLVEWATTSDRFREIIREKYVIIQPAGCPVHAPAPGA